MVLENEPQCTYDYMEMFEPFEKHTNVEQTSKHNQGLKTTNTQTHDANSNFQNVQKKQQLQQQEVQKLFEEYVQHPLQVKNIFQPSNALFNVFRPPPGTSNRMPRVICGDWSSKLKLLRYQTSSNLLGVRFASDYSHNYSGFKAKISMEKGRFLLKDYPIYPFPFPQIPTLISRSFCFRFDISAPLLHTFLTHIISDQIIKPQSRPSLNLKICSFINHKLLFHYCLKKNFYFRQCSIAW